MKPRIIYAAVGLVLACLIDPATGDTGGIRLPGVILRPSLEGAISHDNNVWLVPKGGQPGQPGPESDMLYAAKLQLSVTPLMERVRTRADGWYRLERYQEQNAADSDEWGQRLQMRWGARETWTGSLYQRYVRTDRYDRGPAGRDLDADGALDPRLIDPTLQERVALAKRALFEIGFDAGRDLTDKTTLDARVSFSDVRYDEIRFDGRPQRALNDTSALRLMADLGWRATDKTTLFLAADSTRHDSDAFDSVASEMGLRLGVTTPATDKLRYRAALGYARYDYRTYDGPEALTRRSRLSDESDTDRSARSENLSFEVGLLWTPAERWRIQTRGFSRFQPTVQYGGNASYHMAGQANVDYRVARNLHLNLNAGYRREDYQETVLLTTGADAGREIDKYVDISTLSARVAFKPERRPTMAYVEARNSRSVSNDPQAEFDAVLLTAGLHLWY